MTRYDETVTFFDDANATKDCFFDIGEESCANDGACPEPTYCSSGCCVGVIF